MTSFRVFWGDVNSYDVNADTADAAIDHVFDTLAARHPIFLECPIFARAELWATELVSETSGYWAGVDDSGVWLSQDILDGVDSGRG